MRSISAQPIAQFVLKVFQKTPVVPAMYMLAHTALHNGRQLSNVFDAVHFVFGATKKKQGVKAVAIFYYRLVRNEEQCVADMASNLPSEKMQEAFSQGKVALLFYYKVATVKNRTCRSLSLSYTHQ